MTEKTTPSPLPHDPADVQPIPPPRNRSKSQSRPSISSSSVSSEDADTGSVDTALTAPTAASQTVNETTSQSSSIDPSTPKSSHENIRNTRPSFASQRSENPSILARASAYIMPTQSGRPSSQDWRQSMVLPSETLRNRSKDLRSTGRRKDPPFEYSKYAEQPCRFEKLIQRQLANLSFFNKLDREWQDDLTGMIKAYINFDYHVCDESLPFLVYTLMRTRSKPDAFNALFILLREHGLQGHYTRDKEALHERMDQFDSWLWSDMPEVSDHFKLQGIVTDRYIEYWFADFFAHPEPLDFELLVVEQLFKEGSITLLKIAYTLFELNKETILSLEGNALSEFLDEEIFDVCKTDAKSFIKEASQQPISNKDLIRLSKKHAGHLDNEIHIKEQAECVKQNNLLLEKQVRELEKSYQKLEKDHQNVMKEHESVTDHMTRFQEENKQLKQEFDIITRQRDERFQKELERTVLENKALMTDKISLEEQLSRLESELVCEKMRSAELAAEIDAVGHELRLIKKKG